MGENNKRNIYKTTGYKIQVKKKIDEEHVTSGILELCSICKSTEMVRLNMVCKGKMRNGF